MADMYAGVLAELGGKTRPFLGGQPRPALVMRRAEALALHPDEAEIAARGAVGDIALVDQGAVETGTDETIGDGRADQPATDHDRIKPPHRPARPNRP